MPHFHSLITNGILYVRPAQTPQYQTSDEGNRKSEYIPKKTKIHSFTNIQIEKNTGKVVYEWFLLGLFFLDREQNQFE